MKDGTELCVIPNIEPMTIKINHFRYNAPLKLNSRKKSPFSSYMNRK